MPLEDSPAKLALLEEFAASRSSAVVVVQLVMKGEATNAKTAKTAK
jgi:hypothetical protein